jgi:tetratricopeptide (TPR) repeat protein
MIRPLFAIWGALALLVLWLGLIVVQTKGNPASFVQALGDSASRSQLPGLAARAYVLSAEIQRRHLYNSGVARDSAPGQALIRHIIATRMAAARLLLQSGYIAAAERIALEGARADFDDLQARALLLEVRLRGDNAGASRRELMLMLLEDQKPQLLCLLAASFAREGKLQDAAAAYERALAVDANHVPSLVALAELRAKEGDAAAARVLLTRAKERAEGGADHQLVLAASKRLQAGPKGNLCALAVWFADHGPFALVLVLYLLFLVSPTIFMWFAAKKGKGLPIAPDDAVGL